MISLSIHYLACCRSFAGAFQNRCGSAAEALQTALGKTKCEQNLPICTNFQDLFDVFASFSKFPDMFGPIWMRLDLLGHVRTYSDAFRSVWTLSDKIDNFGISESVFDVSDVILQETFVPAPEALQSHCRRSCRCVAEALQNLCRKVAEA